MFQTVYEILITLFSIEDLTQKLPGWFQYTATILSVLIYVGINITLYLLMAFGIRHIYRKKGLKTNCFIWIPILQFYALIKTFTQTKFLGMKRSTFIIAFLISVFSYYLLGAFIDIYYFAGDICYFIFHGNGTLNTNIQINVVISILYEMLDLVYLFAICGVMYNFFKERSPNFFLFTVLCVFVTDLFPIFVFAFRKRQSQNFGHYKVVYTNQNYGRYENPNGNFGGNANKTEEPFTDFSDKPNDTEYGQPFADFFNQENSFKSQTDNGNSANDFKNTGENSNLTDNEDDLFN